MKYSNELQLIWENYMSNSNVVPFIQADTSIKDDDMHRNATAVDCDHLDKLQHGEQQELKMAQADLLAIHKQVEALMQQLQTAETIPGWVQSKLAIANQYVTDVAQFMDYESRDCKQDTSVSIVKVVAM